MYRSAHDIRGARFIVPLPVFSRQDPLVEAGELKLAAAR
jgi:hypothetical protein